MAISVLALQHASAEVAVSTDLYIGTSKNRVSNSVIPTSSDEGSRKRKSKDDYDYDWGGDDFDRELVKAAEKAEKTELT